MCLAVPGEVREITCTAPLARTGRVAFGGIVREINLTFAPEANVGDFVLVHAGVAIAVLDEAEAARTLACLDSLEEEAP